MDLTQVTLTAVESAGLRATFNFADGHAYQDLSASQLSIVDRLSDVWMASAAGTVPEAEERFLSSFIALANTDSLKGAEGYKICPTASNSIDIAAAWLASERMRVALLEPTFDNLYLLLKRRGVPVIPLPEDLVFNGDIAAFPLAGDVDAIFLVNPNNPTGRTLTREQFEGIATWCLRNKKVLLLDNTFRFFVSPDYDPYRILLDSGVSFISIEDTGKVWPTQDLKASLMFYSRDIAAELELIYEELFLCISSFALGVLTEFLKDAQLRGLGQAVWEKVALRRSLLRTTLRGTPLSVAGGSEESRLSVEWVRVGAPFENDLDIVRYFSARGLVLLPGRNFFWSRNDAPAHAYVRFALLKPTNSFVAGLLAFQHGIHEACGWTSQGAIDGR